ncbi:hypothetical protein [Cohnella rhizosphaerae]|uniref:Uncharacterized protein n=1 Tax=Cohnella rhizosphaerae TaxID=1457232 RepID=A0A9X4KSH0_9BACL|nr:hypothetical protein [Cohnella rhizosphaerae]MDG0810120.1 hypothetical protein [Cohnella rhizosphaerae]
MTANGETETHEVRLRVLRTAVPDESRMILDLNSYADNISRRTDVLRDNPTRYEDGTYFKAERQFYRMAHEHRCLLHYLPYQHSGKMPPTFAPELAGKGKEMRVKDWSAFDEHFGPYLDGSAFADTKRGAIPIPYMYLPFNFHWPADYAKFGMKGYRTEFAGIMEEFHRHFTEKGWLGTKFELFLNHKKRYKLFPYDGDETRFVWDEKINDIFYELSKDVLEKEDGARFIFRTDASWSYGLHFEKYANMIKLWVVNQQMFSWFPESVDVLRAAGCEIWTYGSAERISTSLLATVFSPLAAVARGVDGFTYWESTKWGGAVVRDAGFGGQHRDVLSRRSAVRPSGTDPVDPAQGAARGDAGRRLHGAVDRGAAGGRESADGRGDRRGVRSRAGRLVARQTGLSRQAALRVGKQNVQRGAKGVASSRPGAGVVQRSEADAVGDCGLKEAEAANEDEQVRLNGDGPPGRPVPPGRPSRRHHAA